MTKLSKLINPTLILRESVEKELPDDFTVSERAYNYLVSEVEKLNKKAAKYQVPPLEIEVLGTEFEYVVRPEYKNVNLALAGISDKDKSIYMMPVKKFKLHIKGEPPKIEGYEFISRLEHSKGGNFIYTNPNASVSNLPSEFKSMNQHCDVCHTNRDRNDTFVIKMLEDDVKRFPDNKSGDLLVVGRNCLQRFMPGITINGLIMWTKLIDSANKLIDQSEEFNDDNDGMGGGGSSKSYEDRKFLLTYLVGTYLFTGRYISKKQAQQDMDADMNSISTIERTQGEMHPYKFTEEYAPVYYKLHNDEAFKKRVIALSDEFDQWIPSKDFDKMAEEKPDFANFFNNLKLVSQGEFIRPNHMGFFGALFQLFVRDKNDIEKKKDSQLAMASKPESPVDFDESLIKIRLRDVAKVSKIEQLKKSGKDDKEIKKMIRGHKFGWDVTVKKISQYEKTNTFGYGDSGIGFRMFFEDEYGNEFLWFSSTDIGMKEGEKYSIDGTITGYEAENKYSKRPQIRINRVNVVNNQQEVTPEVVPT